MSTFHSISRRFLVLLLTFSLLLSFAVPAFAEGDGSDLPETEVPVVEEPAVVSTPVAVEPVIEPVAEPVIETVTEEEIVTEEVEVEEIETEEVEEIEAEEVEEIEAEEVEGGEAKTEEVEKLYFWEDPITHAMHSNLTYEDCMAVIHAWIANNPDKILLNSAPTLMGSPAPAPGFTLKEADGEEAVKKEDTAPAEPEETEAAAYDVEFKVDGKEVRFSSGEAVTLPQLLEALGIDVPEGAEVSLDEASVDTKYLTWSEKDGQMVLTFDKGAFAAANNLVVYIDGVATEIGVTDGMTPEAAKAAVATAPAKITTTAPYVIDMAGSAVIDLNGKTIARTDTTSTGDGYAVEIGNTTDPSAKIEVTIMNGVIEAAENAVKVVGNTIVKFVNMTIMAAKNVLNIGAVEVADTNATVTIDKDSKLYSAGKDGADTIVIADAKRGSASSKATNSVTVEGSVNNGGTGYAIGTNAATKGNLNVVLEPTAVIMTTKNPRVFDPNLITSDNKSMIFSKGASVTSGVDLEKFGMTVFDLNYDTEDMLHTISWGSYSAKDLADWLTPSRPGMSFLGWNTKPDGSGTYYTMQQILEKKITHVYAIWGPVDYHWLIAATAKYNGYEVYAATRMQVKDGVATVTFEDAGKHKLDIVKVAVKDLKNLKNRGIKTLHICLSEDLAVEFDMDTLQECVGIDAKGNRYNTADIYNEEGILTAVAGKTALYNLETSALQADTKNAVVAAYAATGLTVRYGKDDMFRVNAANLGASTVLVLKNNKLASLSVDGLDVTRYKDTRNALDKAVTSGSAVAEAAKLK